MRYFRLNRFLFWITILIPVFLCHCISKNPTSGKKQLFTLLDQNHTKIDFINNVVYTEEFNTYTYRNFYNGAGVGIGDFNNDGLPDIYFCANQEGNRLYLNKGNFVFEDITEKAGVSCLKSWSTGVSIADINGDGLLDIYICKSGDPNGKNRLNELFINNGDLTFTEKAKEYGLAVFGLSNHASFFDYDRDGDLDCYLLNNSIRSVTEFEIKPGQREIPDSLGGNKLFRNDDGKFIDVTNSAGIYSSKIGFGLGVSAGDVNKDGWPDIYVSNDFFERDYLYINNGDGTFTESLESQLREISLGSMGSDMADINNDAWPEIFTTEMTAEDNERLKTKVLFESWDIYQIKVKNGYYHQFARNVLQLNNKNNSFSEIGRLSGVSTTDWSWGALIMDMDNDGWKDIFVANGIYKDLLDRDFLDIYSNPSIMRSLIKSEESAIMSLIEKIPSVRIPNYAFHNNGDLTFTNFSDKWGLNAPSFSNGAAYGDLDNDGDLDLVVNNVNMPPFIYRNESRSSDSSNYLTLTLRGTGKNTGAIGSNVTLWYEGIVNYQENIPMRGFKSSADHRLHFGLGSADSIDSLIVSWPDGKITVLREIAVNQSIIIDQKDAVHRYPYFTSDQNKPVFENVNLTGLDFTHRENDFVDFERDRLLFRMLSTEGPHIAVEDVDGNGLEDMYICGAKDQPGALFIQNRQGHFKSTNLQLFENDKKSEDTDCEFFDADGDGDPDLYVTCGGNEFPSSSSLLLDKLYINNGKGEFSKSSQLLPTAKYESSSCVESCDFDNDGDLDLFVGIRLRPFEYGLPANGYLLENDGQGNFSNATSEKAPGLINIGMITDMKWADIDNDGDSDMAIAGEWMPVRIFINNQGVFKDESEKFGLLNTEGWWNTIETADLNGDGNIDFILGNHGLNSFFKASAVKPLTMYVNDFDLNGSVEQIICGFKGDKSYPLVMKDDLVKQIPSLKNKYQKYEDYKNQTIENIFPPEVLNRSLRLTAKIMESCVMINTGDKSFILKPLPTEAQFSPVYAIAANDFDSDGTCDILTGGNLYRAKPETGIYGASYGLFLKGINNEKWQAVSPLISGIFTKGEIRDMKTMIINDNKIIIVARNNDSIQFYKY
ncbi:MAG: VCBS repeat-containing protein [Bacteroidales bacterium]|nr:VCBS repeat-containing protein [Bacteroidales bacterium]